MGAIIIIAKQFKDEIKEIENAGGEIIFNTKRLDFGYNDSTIINKLNENQNQLSDIVKRYKEHVQVLVDGLNKVVAYFEKVDKEASDSYTKMETDAKAVNESII